MRKSEQVQAEIQERFGFIPPFFGPALQNTQVLENLWQQTLFAYVDNPLSTLFKEKLSAYLSRYCAIPYCMICHSCSLRPLGVRAQEVLELLESPPPLELAIDKHLQKLAAHAEILPTLSAWTVEIEESLLYCAIFIFLKQSDQADYCRAELRQLLGPCNYQHLITFLTYVKTCHSWMEAHPEVAYEADQRVQNHLAALLEDEPGLVDFLQNYRHRVRQEQQSWAEQSHAIAVQKQETALRQVANENLLLVRAVASASDGILITDPNQPDNPIVYANPAFSRITGYQFNEVIGCNCRFLQGADTDPQTVYQLRQAIAERREIKVTLLNYRKDGEPFWNELKLSPVFSEAQELLYFVGIQTDITERKRAEEQIRAHATLLDKSQDAILVLDTEDQILFWNKSAQRLFGWLAGEAVGQKADQLLFQETSLQFKAAKKAVLNHGEWHGELRQFTKDGKKVVVESRWTLVRNEHEKTTSILLISTDITEKKQLESHFLRTQRMESIGTLASGIAHDLNNVLAPILMATQLLEMKVHDEKSRWLLNMMEVNAKRGANLVKQVLSFARGVEGDRTTLQAGHLILEVEKIARETFPKSIEIQSDVSILDLWTISGDATQLHQVLVNLCVNARDAMPHGGTLSIHAENLIIPQDDIRLNLGANPGAYILVTVTDTGTGISSELIDRIFEPFFTTKELGKGTGLGLSTVVGIVKGHGGFINVSSEIGQGTQFQVYLPATALPEMLEKKEQHTVPLGHGELILVVDDEVAICEITKSSLETYDYTVLTANDGIEAIALYAQHKDAISAVVLDMMMPSMDGPTTMRLLQRLNPQVKIVAVSGLAANYKAEVANSNVKTFLTKPYSAEELLQNLHGVLSVK